MAKLEGAKTVVVGGKANTQQQYCGVVGGQSTSFASVDSEVKTAHLKDHPAAPPDLYVLPSCEGRSPRTGTDC